MSLFWSQLISLIFKSPVNTPTPLILTSPVPFVDLINTPLLAPSLLLPTTILPVLLPPSFPLPTITVPSPEPLSLLTPIFTLPVAPALVEHPTLSVPVSAEPIITVLLFPAKVSVSHAKFDTFILDVVLSPSTNTFLPLILTVPVPFVDLICTPLVSPVSAPTIMSPVCVLSEIVTVAELLLPIITVPSFFKLLPSHSNLLTLKSVLSINSVI